MQERIYTLKKGTEVPAQFDGVTVPFQVPSTLAEVIGAAGGSTEDVSAVSAIEGKLSEVARKNAVAVFNQAHALNVQKNAKEDAQEEGATVEKIRAGAASFKYGQVRVRGASTGSAKPSAAKVTAALGDDFLSTLTPEQRKLYDEKMAALNVKPAAPAAAPAPTETPAPAQATGQPAATTGKKK
jgi:hypothetical protein